MDPNVFQLVRHVHFVMKWSKCGNPDDLEVLWFCTIDEAMFSANSFQEVSSKLQVRAMQNNHSQDTGEMGDLMFWRRQNIFYIVVDQVHIVVDIVPKLFAGKKLGYFWFPGLLDELDLIRGKSQDWKLIFLLFFRQSQLILFEHYRGAQRAVGFYRLEFQTLVCLCDVYGLGDFGQLRLNQDGLDVAQRRLVIGVAVMKVAVVVAVAVVGSEKLTESGHGGNLGRLRWF